MSTSILKHTTVAELVANDYRTAGVFRKYGIDFCCGGRKTLETVGLEKGIDLSELARSIQDALEESTVEEKQYQFWTLAALIDHIVNVHHCYVNENMVAISSYAEKVARVHGAHHPETQTIFSLWQEVETELTIHMKKEELVLFPYIKNLERFSRGELDAFPFPHFGTVKNPITMMRKEHEVAGSLMKRIQELSDQFTPPDYACNTYRVLYAKLQEFQDDLIQHIHLENNILFPKVEALEEKWSI